ncbi:energy-coupling factor ABC transporter ATP-binding protein [Microbacterium sp. EF45047]|uniref:energy-coupling factor ABC transporter ATP-binding protein n=1 Tax=Microbacterium sp. EF45047 TaxID=2809708 RepID=UPI00234903C7|nr:ABC transporter ATP-binding protein [Microbacterium sp. EF45047]WCM54782.1 ABC transporter ATP-binding protein [Microbacterium sp. EF45047]
MRPETAAEPRATGGGIVADGVGLTIDGREVLHDVTLRLTARRTAVIGANGSGKSSFARLLNGLRMPTAGALSVLGLDPRRDAAALRARVGFVFTNPEAQILMPTPAEDVALSLRGLGRREADARAREILAGHGLDALADVPASALSGGQRQLLAIASVLASGPAMLVADEPTTLLDLRNARRIGDLLLGLEIPVVLVTHDLELAARCEEAVLFQDGRVRAVGEPETVIRTYRAECG